MNCVQILPKSSTHPLARTKWSCSRKNSFSTLGMVRSIPLVPSNLRLNAATSMVCGLVEDIAEFGERNPGFQRSSHGADSVEP
ncbi:hypothetical protein KSP39_PZI013030 [Platanthera zijinensis]|uniref:Uncharacterized protein n=1 Tax=Platanthera zijinensis TaxID=2320716 RepID=A0AAP0G3P7_9ASPA